MRGLMCIPACPKFSLMKREASDYDAPYLFLIRRREMGAVTRRAEIDKRRRRKAKLKRLRERIAKAKDGREVQKIVEKILRVHPFYPIQTDGK